MLSRKRDNDAEKRNLSNTVKSGLVVAGGLSIPFLFSSAAHADYDVVSESIKGLNEYLIFHHEGASLSSAEIFAEKLVDTELSVVIVTQDQLGSKDPVEVANTIQQNTEQVDAVILVVDGDKDSMYVGSENKALESSLQEVIGTSEVDDAGWSLVNNSDDLILSYALSGGNISDEYMNAISANVKDSAIIQNSIAGLSKDHVFVNDGAALSNEEVLESSFTPGEIEVVVVPASETILSAEQVGEIVLEDHESNSLIVVIDGEEDQISVVSENSELESEMSSVIGSENVEDAGETLASVHTELVAVEDSYLTPSEKASTLFGGAGIALGFAVVSVLAVKGVQKLVKIKKAKIERELTYEKKLKEKYDKVSDDLLDSMVGLEKLSAQHSESNSSQSLSSEIKELSKKLHDMLDVLEDNKISEGKRRQLEIGYADKIDKLSNLLGDKYYLDLLDNADYWDSSDDRVRKVQEVLSGMTSNVVENIRRVNKDHDIDVQVALAALEGVNQRYVSNVFEKKAVSNSVQSPNKAAKKNGIFKWMKNEAS